MSEDASIELTEEVVDEFIESVPMARRLTQFRNKKKNKGKGLSPNVANDSGITHPISGVRRN